MSKTIQWSQVINRPVDKVFTFFATDHVKNHPRWDPKMELEQVSDGPMGVGTVIRRRNSHSGAPVEGTMKVVEYDPNRAFGMIIHDGSVEMLGRVTFEAIDDQRTLLTQNLEIPDMDESADMSHLIPLLERAGEIRKSLTEAEP